MEVEVVAEKSLEEVEREKLRRAREEGDYLDLTSSQVETVTTPPEREVANEKKPSGRRACPFSSNQTHSWFARYLRGSREGERVTVLFGLA